MQKFSCLTQIKQYAVEKGRNTLYLFLKNKPLYAEAIEKLNEKFQKKLDNYIDKIIPELQKMNPEDPEKLLKYILLQAVKKILNDIINEEYNNLTENDKISSEKILNNKHENKMLNKKIEENYGNNFIELSKIGIYN